MKNNTEFQKLKQAYQNVTIFESNKYENRDMD